MEKPILFSAPMVNAILEGRKKQTRRVVKPQPQEHHWQIFGKDYKQTCVLLSTTIGTAAKFYDWHKKHVDQTDQRAKSKYEVGDTLWVRETFAHTYQLGLAFDDENYGYVYRADGQPWEEYEGWKWKPSIFMPREASRISLAVKGVRVERLQDISEEDAISEGVERINYKGIECWKSYTNTNGFGNARDSFWSLWTKINGKESWDSNPWVWVYDFERLAIEKGAEG